MCVGEACRSPRQSLQPLFDASALWQVWPWRCCLSPRWGCPEATRHHLDDRCFGTLAGAMPAAYLEAHRLDPCSVCGLLVRQRFNGARPRCRPFAPAHLLLQASSVTVSPSPFLRWGGVVAAWVELERPSLFCFTRPHRFKVGWGFLFGRG